MTIRRRRVARGDPGLKTETLDKSWAAVHHRAYHRDGLARLAGTLHSFSAKEIKARIEAEREGRPFLVYRDASGGHQLRVLGEDQTRLTVGRRSSSDICLEWDEEVSRLHAELVRVGEDWTVVDDGLSSNGTYVNGERLTGRRRLRDGDALRLGDTVMIYRQPRSGESTITALGEERLTLAGLSELQRRVLVALCRPFKESSAFAAPATNQQIADEVFLSVEAVKTQLRALFRKFQVEGLPQNQKRLRLVERALQSGIISEREL